VTYRQGDVEKTATGSFLATDGHRRGPIRVDPKYPWHFIWEGTGEHYFFDVLLGWLYAAAVMGGWAWWERRRSVARAEAVPARVPLTEPGLPRTGRA
jgi:hypothetical protein